jgi:hypothetical protein
MRHVFNFRTMMLATVVAAVGIAVGCTGNSQSLRTEASTSGIRAAEEVGAAKVPQASLHLQMAKEELELAKGLATKGEKKEAASMLMRAEADSELAVALSRGDAEKSEALSAVERVRELQKDNL